MRESPYHKGDAARVMGFIKLEYFTDLRIHFWLCGNPLIYSDKGMVLERWGSEGYKKKWLHLGIDGAH